MRSKTFSYKCENNIAKKNKIKGISQAQSKHIKFEEYKNCLNGDEYRRECNNYILRSINHEVHLQQLKKSTLSIFDDKRCYIIETECKHCN